MRLPSKYTTRVRPGDIIFSDIDGVLCVPREIAYNESVPKRLKVMKMKYSNGYGVVTPFRKSLTKAVIFKMIKITDILLGRLEQSALSGVYPVSTPNFQP